MLAPGATIGILGGGQLGRMMAMAAAQLGLKCHIYAPERDSVAAEVSAEFTCAHWTDESALERFVAACDVVTYEFENVPTTPLAFIPQGKLHPPVRALEISQDRLREKRFIEELGGRPAPYRAVDSAGDLAEALERIGTPGILKTRRDGYDGKGQWRIRSARDAEAFRLPAGDLIYEGFVNFEAEFSVILVRGQDGAIRYYDSAQNIHEDGILATSTLPPAPIVVAQVDEAHTQAAKAAEALGHVGVLTLEFFATKNGPVFNEMAPRVHNSGHWTIEGTRTSQFENHIRAIAGMPLGDTSLSARSITMRNLIGEAALAAAPILADSANHLHLYGKAEARPGRKMGHVTRLTA